MKRSTQGLGMEFWPVEKSLREEFLPDLFLGAEVHMPDRKVTGLTVKHSWLAIPDPTLMAHGNWNTLCVVTEHLVVDLCSRIKFRSGDHAKLLTSGHTDI